MRDIFFNTESDWLLDMGEGHAIPSGTKQEWLTLIEKVRADPKGEHKVTKRLAYKDGFYQCPRNDGGCYLPEGVTVEDLYKTIMGDGCLTHDQRP